MKDLKNFKKRKAENNKKVTSVAITLEQHKFFKDNGLNVSQVIRKLLSDFIEQNKKEGEL